MRSCGCHQCHHHEYGSSSNSPSACREWEGAWVVECWHRCHQTRLVVGRPTTVATTTTVVVASAIVSVTAIVESVLLLWRGIDVGCGLLADSHADLLDVR